MLKIIDKMQEIKTKTRKNKLAETNRIPKEVTGQVLDIDVWRTTHLHVKVNRIKIPKRVLWSLKELTNNKIPGSTLKDPFSLTVMLCALFVVKRGHWPEQPLLDQFMASDLRVVKGIFVTRDRPFFPPWNVKWLFFFFVNRDFHSSREVWFCKLFSVKREINV